MTNSNNQPINNNSSSSSNNNNHLRLHHLHHHHQIFHHPIQFNQQQSLPSSSSGSASSSINQANHSNRFQQSSQSSINQQQQIGNRIRNHHHHHHHQSNPSNSSSSSSSSSNNLLMRNSFYQQSNQQQTNFNQHQQFLLLQQHQQHQQQPLISHPHPLIRHFHQNSHSNHSISSPSQQSSISVQSISNSQPLIHHRQFQKKSNLNHFNHHHHHSNHHHHNNHSKSILSRSSLTSPNRLSRSNSINLSNPNLPKPPNFSHNNNNNNNLKSISHHSKSNSTNSNTSIPINSNTTTSANSNVTLTPITSLPTSTSSSSSSSNPTSSVTTSNPATTTTTTTTTTAATAATTTTTPSSSLNRQTHSASNINLSTNLDEHLGLIGPHLSGHLSSTSIELNPWIGCLPCKWKFPLSQTGLPSTNHPNLQNVIINNHSNEIESHPPILDRNEWKINWVKVLLVNQSNHHSSSSLNQVQFETSRHLDSLGLTYVFSRQKDLNQKDKLLDLVWIYQLPGQTGSKNPSSPSIHQSYHSNQILNNNLTNQPLNQTSSSITSDDPHQSNIFGLNFKLFQTVLSQGVLSHSQIFPNIFSRSKTSSLKPFLPHLSHHAKNLTGNDYLSTDSSQLESIVAYVNFLRALTQYIIRLAIRSSSTCHSSYSTKWIRWGHDHLLSIPRDESLEYLYRNLNHDPSRLLGALLASPLSFQVNLQPWISSRVAICQPSFIARRLLPLPPPQYSIPPGFPLLLAPFSTLRAKFVRFFARFDHHSASRHQSKSSPTTFSSNPSSFSFNQIFPNSNWISLQKKICKAESKHLEKLQQLWRDKFPFNDELFINQLDQKQSNSTTHQHQSRTIDTWLVCKVSSQSFLNFNHHDNRSHHHHNHQESEFELVWPIDHCLLDFESWITTSDQTSMSDISDLPLTSPPNLSSSLPIPRFTLANSLIRSSFEPIDELAEDAGCYIDWVAQERELQRRAAAANKEKNLEDNLKIDSTSSPLPISVRVGMNYNKLKGLNYSSPRFQPFKSSSNIKTSPSLSQLINTPKSLSKKRRRGEFQDSIDQHQSNGLLSIFHSDPSISNQVDQAQNTKDHLNSNELFLESSSIPSINQNHQLLSNQLGLDTSILEDIDFEYFGDSTHSNNNLVNSIPSQHNFSSSPQPPPQSHQSDSVQLSISSQNEFYHQINPNSTTSQSSTSVMVSTTTSTTLPQLQQGSGSDSTTSTISFTTNLFEQPTPGSISISGLTPGRLNGLTPDGTYNLNHPIGSQPVIYSSPIHPNHHHLNHHHSNNLNHHHHHPNNPQLNLESSSDHHFNNHALSYNNPSSIGVKRISGLMGTIEPKGYESIEFNDFHRVIDDNYNQRGGKFALPPSPDSFNDQDEEATIRLKELNEQEEGKEEEDEEQVEQEGLINLFEKKKPSSFLNFSKKLMRVTDPRSKLIRGLFNSNFSTSSPQIISKPNSSSKILNDGILGNTNFQSQIASYGEIPPTPRSWVPIHSPNDSIDNSICSDEEEDEQEEEVEEVEESNQFNLNLNDFNLNPKDSSSKIATTHSSNSSSHDDNNNYHHHEDHQMNDNAYFEESQETISKNIQRLEKSLEKVLNYYHYYQFNHDDSCSTNVKTRHSSKLNGNNFKSSSKKKLKNWVNQLGDQLEHDPNLEFLLETVLPINQNHRGQEILMDEIGLPIIEGFDYYQPKIDDLFEIQDCRLNDDSRPYFLAKSMKPPMVIVRYNQGHQKITFPICQLRHWIKLGLEPVSGKRDVTLSIIFPRNFSLTIGMKPLVENWLRELTFMYKACKFGEISIGKIHESKYEPGQLKLEVEEMLNHLKRPKTTRHACLVVVDRLRDMRSLVIGEDQIRGLDGRPVTRLVVCRQQLVDDRPASLMGQALRLYDSMKILVDRFKAPGLELNTNFMDQSWPIDRTQLISEGVNFEESSSDCDSWSEDEGRREVNVGRNGQEGRQEEEEEADQEEIDEEDDDAAESLEDEDDLKKTIGQEDDFRMRRIKKLLSGHAFFLSGFPKPIQLNLRWPPSGIDVGARHRFLHVGYLIGSTRRWVLVSIIDELGQEYKLKLKFSHSRRWRRARQKRNHWVQIDANVDENEIELVETVWRVLMKVILTTNVEWRIVITKLGKLEPVEYRAWCELFSQLLPKSELAFHVTLSSLMIENVPILKRARLDDEPGSISGTTERGGIGGDLEIGEVEPMEEVEENVGGGGGGMSSANCQEEDGTGFERIFSGPELIWVSHESTIRPHSISESLMNSLGTNGGRLFSINEMIVHCLCTSYFYQLKASNEAGMRDESNIGSSIRGMRLDLLGTGSTINSVYQPNLFQHREEITQSFIQLSKLRFARMNLNKSNFLDESEKGGKLEILPIHIICLKIVGDRLNNQIDKIFKMLEDDDDEDNDDIAQND